MRLFTSCKWEELTYSLLMKPKMMMSILNHKWYHIAPNGAYYSRTMVFLFFRLPLVRHWWQVSSNQVATWLKLWVILLVKYVLALMIAIETNVFLRFGVVMDVIYFFPSQFITSVRIVLMLMILFSPNNKHSILLIITCGHWIHKLNNILIQNSVFLLRFVPGWLRLVIIDKISSLQQISLT